MQCDLAIAIRPRPFAITIRPRPFASIRKVGGIWFLSIGRIRLSFCLASKGV